MVSRTSLLTLFPPHHHDFSLRVWKIMFFMLQFKCSQPAYAQFGGVCSFSSWKPSRYTSLWAMGLLGEILLVPARLGAERNGHSNCAASFKISYLESRQPDVGTMMFAALACVHSLQISLLLRVLDTIPCTQICFHNYKSPKSQHRSYAHALSHQM
ncbi:hypothetical protein XENOCAPTIV_006164 [Xenoophorus captivus]|uniref:Uncharacterized protein n=1 Tax=Xenoophorus captivus TaxID=1517983 RepID=A0ABV0QHT9_9TELE